MTKTINRTEIRRLRIAKERAWDAVAWADYTRPTSTRDVCRRAGLPEKAIKAQAAYDEAVKGLSVLEAYLADFTDDELRAQGWRVDEMKAEVDRMKAETNR